MKARTHRPHARAALAGIVALAAIAAGGAARAQRAPAKTSSVAGTYTGVMSSRTRVFKWSVFGQRSQRRVTIGLTREGDKVRVRQTSHDLLGPGQNYTTSTTGHVVSEGVNGRGEPELKVTFGGQGFVEQWTRAARAAERAKGVAPMLSIVDAAGEATYTFRKDGSMHVNERADTRINIDTGGLDGWLMRAISRTRQRGTSTGDLMKTGR